MAAYISEVAIDAALMDSPTIHGQSSSLQSSHTRDEAGGEDGIGMSHLRAGSSVSHLHLPYAIEEYQGELDKHPLVAGCTDMQ